MPAMYNQNLSSSLSVKQAGRLALLILALLGSVDSACYAGNDSISRCGHSTVADAWGPEHASQAEIFLIEIQHAIKINDRVKLSSLVKYPIHIYGTGYAKEIRTPADFVMIYPSIMTPFFRQKILNQPPKCLFGNGQGVMIGSGGEIWFQKQPSGEMKIITFNPRANR